MSLITISCANPPKVAPNPLATVTAALVQPAAIRSRLYHWLPGQPSGSGMGMRFDQGITRDQITACENTCAAQGSDWCPYIGVLGLETMPVPDREQILGEYRKKGTVGAWIGLDNAAANHNAVYNGIIESTARTWMKWDGCVALEANGDFPWIRSLIAKFGKRVGIMANQWMWDKADTNPAWFSIETVAALGARSIVLVTAPAQDFNAGEWTREEIGDAKMEAVRKWAARGADEICVRPSWLSPADILELVSMSA